MAGDEIYWTTIIRRTRKTKQVQITNVPTMVWWQKTKNTAAMSLKTTFTMIKQQKNLQNTCQTWDPHTGSCPNKNRRRRANWNKRRRKYKLRRLHVIHMPNRRSECGGAWRSVQRQGFRRWQISSVRSQSCGGISVGDGGRRNRSLLLMNDRTEK